jgi:hypothetical protein
VRDISARRKTARIVVVNPFRERALPGIGSLVAERHLRDRLADDGSDCTPGGDRAFLTGVLKALIRTRRRRDVRGDRTAGSSSA